MIASDRQHLRHLRSETFSILRDVFGSHVSEVVFLDAPTHRNFGDSFIWEGTHTYLKRLGCRVKYTANIKHFKKEGVQHLPREIPIVLHGGGNMGDLWLAHELFRRRVVQAYGHRRIVIMPQSIHFENPAELQESVRIYGAAHNLTILLRDSKSMQVAQTHFKGIDYRFCPDTAFGMKIPAKAVNGSQDPLVLARTDREARSHDRISEGMVKVIDWKPSRANQRFWRMASRLLRQTATSHRRSGPKAMSRELAYKGLRGANLHAAIQQISGAPWLVTNRLHCHILASLMGIPHFVTDNTYGKISTIYNDYSGIFSTANWADSLSEGLKRSDYLIQMRTLPRR